MSEKSREMSLRNKFGWLRASLTLSGGVRGLASAFLHVLASEPFMPMISYSSPCFALCVSTKEACLS